MILLAGLYGVLAYAMVRKSKVQAAVDKALDLGLDDVNNSPEARE